MRLYDTLHGQYPVQKTLRWELKPVGKTMDYLIDKQIIETDEVIADHYKKIKKIIDRFHKKVISESLIGETIPNDLLLEYYEKVKASEDIEATQARMRSAIVKKMQSHPSYANLFLDKLVKEELPAFIYSEEERKIVDTFNRFSTLLQNYHTVRKNLYSAEEKHSTVAFRLIHENLPKFYGNLRVFKNLEKSGLNYGECIETLQKYLGTIDLSILFCIDGYNSFLTQNGIDFYNQVIGGVSTETEKIQGLNEIINLWNQSHAKAERLPLFVPLYKQLLSEGTTQSFIIDTFDSDEEIVHALTEFNHMVSDVIKAASPIFSDFSQYDCDGIFIKNGPAITVLSQQVTGSWNTFSQYLSDKYDTKYSGRKRIGTEAYEEEKKRALKAIKSVTISELEESQSERSIYKEIASKFAALEEAVRLAWERLYVAIVQKDVYAVSFIQNQELTDLIKGYLDSLKAVQGFTSLFIGDGNEPERNMSFYGDFAPLIDGLMDVNGLYNKVRNYFTRKPFSEDKIKLNFGVPTLLNGWDANKEEAYLGVILRKDGKYYLGIIDKADRRVLLSMNGDENEDAYQKMEYKQLPGPNKMLPKVFFSKSRIAEFAPSEEIMRIYRSGSFKKGENFDIDDCHALIDFFKQSILKHEDWSKFDFHFSDTSSYEDIIAFYREIAEQGYKVTWNDVSAANVDKLVEDGKLYLFQIWSKDFSEHSKGKPDLQFIYWNMLFDERNLRHTVYKLNGGAEVFFRRKSLEKKVTHKKGEALVNKNPLNPKKTSVFDYDLYKDRRYMFDKILFHIPIAINFINEGNLRINDLVNQAIRITDETYVIGIDRGERNLLYAVVVDGSGRIVEKEQISLNIIRSDANGIIQEVDYHELLDKRERERDKARKNWKSIEQIKNLKRGYLSQAVHVITSLAVKYNAIIVLEDLNSGFMRGRQKIEKQVYQDFEKMLIDKLNYLVTRKTRDMSDVLEPGGALNGFQLTNKFESFAKLGKQSGILFYIPAWNTSKLDPTTGFVNLLYTKYENQEKARDFLSRFARICFNGKYFEFSFDYSDFTEKANGTKTDWTICTVGERLENVRDANENNQFVTNVYLPTEMLKSLLDSRAIEYMHGKNIKPAIISVENDAEFYKGIMKVIKMTLQIRNSTLANEIEHRDFLQSCVKNASGAFYCSEDRIEGLPIDADANGAFNIARKGLMLVQRIKGTDADTSIGHKDLMISNKEWLEYAQSHTV